MSGIVMLFNSLSVGIFGGVLSAAFCNTLSSRRGRLSVAAGLAVLLTVQGFIYKILGWPLLEDIYPLVTHVPLALFLCALTRRRLWPVISVLMAYLCCQLRYWLGLLCAVILGGSGLTQELATLAVTLPLLLFLLRFVAPTVRSFEDRPPGVQWRIGLIPAISYVFDYLVTVYTDLLYRGIPAVLEFMPFVCCAAYLVFLLKASAQERERLLMEQVHNSLNIQVSQTLREISALRESQKQASTYRHDLRHHLQYLSACIDSGRLSRAQEYSHGICAEIEAQKVQDYCENESANLIFSAFAGRCAKNGIGIRVRAVLPPFLSVSDSDLCVLLSNALENALNACQSRTGERIIEVDAYEKGHKLFLQITNPCRADITFKNGLPVTDRPGHGVGVRSICAVVERYGGIYSFSSQGGRFVLRLSL